MTPARALAVLALSATLLTGCVGQDDGKDSVGDERSPQEVMEMAKETLDETPGVELDITGDLPSGVTGLAAATGTGTHDPLAFEGKVSVSAGFTLDVDVIAIDDEVWIALPGQDYAEADPADYNAPNPAALFDPETGLSRLLVKTDGLEKGEDVRGGPDNTETFTEYTGTVPASEVEAIIPSATGDDFQVAYKISSDGQLREARVTGEFYPGSDDVTYTIELDGYGTEKDIKAP